MITREPFFTTDSDSFLDTVRTTLFALIQAIGRGGLLTLRALFLIPAQCMTRRARKEFLRQLYSAGIKCLPVITIVGMFIGMIMGLQVGLELRYYNREAYIGSAIMISMLREMGPFMTGLVLASCAGSSMAAQIGTMTVNDEIAALEIMSISPVRFLMAPRMAAMALIAPLLAFYTCVLGIIGGGIVGVTQLDVPWDRYMRIAMNSAKAYDLYIGLLKALLFGILITGVSCYQGFTATQGAVGVGNATRRSVIISFLLILVIGYIITRLCYDL